ncbi:unnamed protein product [Arabidopsis lyrata]|nr:unnamed protein product [Arabidopsis lyrata]
MAATFESLVGNGCDGDGELLVQRWSVDNRASTWWISKGNGVTVAVRYGLRRWWIRPVTVAFVG